MPWEPLPTESDGDPSPMARGLDQVLRSLGAPNARSVGSVFERWEELIGVQIAAHVRPLSLRNATLVVAVDDPAWATEMRFIEADLLTRIKGVLGDEAVTAIEVRVSPSSTKN